MADSKACAEVGEPRKMVVLCSRAIEAGDAGRLPDAVLVLTYSNRAFAYAGMGLFANALRDYGAALSINASDAKTYAGRAQVNNLMNNWQDAVADYTAAIKLKPDFAAAHHNRALVYAQHRNFDKAIAGFTKSLELVPQDVDAVYNRAYAYYLQGTYAAAIEDFNSALKITPEHQNALELRGVSYVLMGLWPQAIADLKKSLTLDPNDAVRMLLLYVAQTRTPGLAAGARKALKKYSHGLNLAAWPGPAVLFCLGKLTQNALFAEIAKETDATERAKRTGFASFYAAEQNLAQGKRAEARRLFEKAAKIGAKGSVEQRAAENALKRLPR